MTYFALAGAEQELADSLGLSVGIVLLSGLSTQDALRSRAQLVPL